MSKIGLIFGSYNPPHKGHAFLADYALKNGSIDEVWFILQTNNPFKSTGVSTDVHYRLEMLRLLAKLNKNYKVHVTNANNIPATLLALQSAFEHSFSLIMGSDLMSTFHTWEDYEQLKSYNVISVQRTKRYSSAEVRASIKTGKPISHFVEPAIEHYIIQNQLYQG